MLTPYSNSNNLGEIINDEVKVMATSLNNQRERWALVEVLGRIGENRYGYVEVDSLSNEIEGKFEYDSLNVDESLESIQIGDNMEAVINQFGHDYYIIKDSNAYQIGYNTADGGHIVFTIDSRMLKVMGIRIASKEYKLNNGLALDLPWTSIYEIYSENEVKIYEGRHIINVGDGFVIQIQLADDELLDVATITRIDIEPDWNGVF